MGFLFLYRKEGTSLLQEQGVLEVNLVKRENIVLGNIQIRGNLKVLLKKLKD